MRFQTQAGPAPARAISAAITSLIFATGAAVAPGLALAAEAPASNEQLEERLRLLERKLEIQDEEAATKARDQATVSAGSSGFSLKSAGGDYTLNIRLLTQADGRYYLGSPAAPAGSNTAARDSFLFRRIEPGFNGALGKLVGYNLTLRLDGDRSASSNGLSSAVVQDVYLDLRFHPLATLRFGKWKEPLSLENLESSAALPFIERGYPTALTGNRDFGVAIQGNAYTNRLSYTAGVFNGATDGQDAPANDSDGRKEFVGRVFAEPFRNEYGFFRGLGAGIAGSYGTKRSPTVTPAYNSDGQINIFRYAAAVTASGQQTRLVPQAYFYRGSFGLLAEYARSRQELANGAHAATVDNEAYELTATYVLSGEDAAYADVRPRQPFAIGSGGWGAFEVAARHGSLNIDDTAFAGTAATRLADPAVSVKRARSSAIGLNWYLTANVKLVSDFNFTRFEGGAAGGGNRRDERALFTRAQLSF
ncbi:MAG: hypothetical protein NVS9B10_21870 [Nevskia sp.]